MPVAVLSVFRLLVSTIFVCSVRLVPDMELGIVVEMVKNDGTPDVEGSTTYVNMVRLIFCRQHSKMHKNAHQ